MELELVSKNEPEKLAVDPSPKDRPMLYSGPERRKMLRRIVVDRREMIRFESKSDRRQQGERRGELNLWDGRSF